MRAMRVFPLFLIWNMFGTNLSAINDATEQRVQTDVRPLLELVMITLNEAATIEHTLSSVKPFIDRYTILDTGSTDETTERIKSAFRDGPTGQVRVRVCYICENHHSHIRIHCLDSSWRFHRL